MSVQFLSNDATVLSVPKNLSLNWIHSGTTEGSAHWVSKHWSAVDLNNWVGKHDRRACFAIIG